MYQGPPGPGFPAPAPALVYTLLSSAPQDPITHNIMRIPDPKFNLDTMIPPVRMVREKPEPRRRREDPAAAAQAGDGTIKPEGAEGDVAPADGKEKPDTTKIAPFGNAIKTRQKRFHKKTKIYTLSRDPSLVHGPNGPPPKKYKRDPDRHPYVLSDFEGTTQYSGQVQGQTDSTYMAFVVQGGTLKAVPISKWYKFMPQAKYRTYTAEEAAEMMKKQSRKRLDTWVMHRKNKTEDGAAVNVKEEPTDVKPKEEKAYMKKLLGTDGQDMVRDGRDRKDDDAAELDFEAGFSDDEDIRFGMEDEEDEKEAKNRQYGKHGKRSGFMDDDDADDDDERGEQQRSKSSSAVGKKLKNALKKVDQADEVDLPDEENPYNSEMVAEDSDDDEPEPEDPDVKLEPGVKRKADGETPGGLAPGMIKKLKGDGGVSPAMSSPEYSATIGRKKKPTRSPMHPGAMSSSPLGRAGSSSPASGNSPMGSSKLGKKRKGAASSDDERSDKVCPDMILPFDIP
ncbi:hypothetical protein HKX48_008597 [Thoreauomyces humboldtii]|nr:hypothetical protein HKX48_008597 [Thoreauomyces humboldtii]